MQELFNYCYKLFSHVQKTQKDSYKSVVEQFYQQFTSLRWKMPKEIDQKLEDDLFPQEAMKKKLQQRKNKQQNSKMNAPRVSALPFTSGKMVQKLTVQDKSVHSGMVLTKKVREVGLPKRFNGYLPLKSILRQITQIFEDRIRQIRESRLAPDTEMCIFVFNKFIHQYGFKNVAEQKYLHFLMNILNYQQIFRVNLFARLIGVFQHDEDNYTIEEMDKYISCWHFLISGSTMGSAIPFNESDLRVYTHYLRALDLLKVKLEKILPPDYINELRAFIESNKELEQKQTNKLVVDVDQLLSRVLVKYRMTINSTKVYVRNAFLASDLDGNGSINLNEFLTLYRHIELETFTFTKAFKMFESHADIITEDEKCLSFQKFTALCLQNHLFLDAAQRNFIGVRESYEIEPQFLELKADWQNEKLIITNYIESLKPFVQIETYEVWRDVLLVLQDRILKNQKLIKDNNSSQSEKKNLKPGSLKRINSKEEIQQNNSMNNAFQQEYQFNVMPILIAHKLLKLELKRLVEVGQNEENYNEGDLNSESNDDLDNEYADENPNNNNNTTPNNINNNNNNEIQSDQKTSKSAHQNKRNNFEDEVDSDMSQLVTQENIANKKKGPPKIDLVDGQIYQFSDMPVVRETPNSSQKNKNKQKNNQSKNQQF